MSKRRYWAKFYWEDWESDPALRLCSLAAQGLWMRMLCIAAKADPFGYVTVNGRPLDYKALARLTGETEETVEHLLSELDRNGVFSRDRKGRIYSRRMVRDFRKAQTAQKNGKKGGNPTLCKNRRKSASDNHQDKPPDKLQDTKMLDAKMLDARIYTPSVLPDGSTSPPLDEVSNRPDDPEGKTSPPSEAQSVQAEPQSQAKPKRKASTKRGSRFADSRWGGVVPDDWLAWAEERGLPAVAAKEEAEKFADYWAGVPGQKGVKLDWEATWRNWVRRALESRGASADERSRRRQDEAVSPSSDFDVPDDLDAIEAQLRKAAGVQASISPALFDLSPIVALLRDGFSLEYDILPKARELRRRGKDFYSWRYLERIVRSEATATTGASAPKRPADRWPEAARFSADDWSARLAMARSKRVWDYVSWGPPPGHPGCLVPSELLRSDDGIGWMIRTGEAA